MKITFELIRTVPLRTRIYALIALILALVLLIQEVNEPSRNTVRIPALSSDVDKIEFKEGEDSLTLFKQETWTVTDMHYAADEDRVSKLLETIGNQRSAEVISLRGSYSDYGLDQENERIIRFMDGANGDLLLRLGNTSSAGDFLYARIDDNKSVVMLPLRLDELFSTDPSDYRDKQMAHIPEDEIQQVTISAPDHPTIEIARRDETDEADEESEDDANKGDESAAGDEWKALSEDQEVLQVEVSQIQSLLRQLDPLRADGFSSQEPAGSPFASLKIDLKGGDFRVISIWPPEDSDEYPIRVSTRQYSFTIAAWKARQLLLNLDRYFTPFEEAEN